ncbi:hypothetical protein CAEBREN_12661 [Caenorhabditis brenneri]|uniref:Uncharacterized protein n=1 Tax=Caenorhabditis brenneri TaxID=135651 RepID=G0NAP6_CAEBE|nr:hypothetical protein CAEBREN_12661 [Caenorhabditis brenneri]
MRRFFLLTLLFSGVLLATTENESMDANDTSELIEAIHAPKPAEHRKACNEEGTVVLDYGTLAGIVMASFLIGMLFSFAGALPFFSDIVCRTALGNVLRALLTRLNKQRNKRLEAEKQLETFKDQIKSIAENGKGTSRIALAQILCLLQTKPKVSIFSERVAACSFFVVCAGTLLVACNAFDDSNTSKNPVYNLFYASGSLGFPSFAAGIYAIYSRKSARARRPVLIILFIIMAFCFVSTILTDQQKWEIEKLDSVRRWFTNSLRHLNSLLPTRFKQTRKEFNFIIAQAKLLVFGILMTISPDGMQATKMQNE